MRAKNLYRYYIVLVQVKVNGPKTRRDREGDRGTKTLTRVSYDT